MWRTGRTLLIVALCGLLLVPESAARASGPIILLVWPLQGHSGDTFYLSGSGYLPRTQLTFQIACPNYTDPNAYYHHNTKLYIGPVTNQNGDFSGYPISGFTLNDYPSSPCAIEASYPDKPFVCTQCALYDIIPRTSALPLRSRVIMGRVRAVPQRVHAGVTETITVSQSWGGASARISIRLPHQAKKLSTEFHLDWRGQGHGILPIAGNDIQQPGVASVSVSFSLGDKRGRAATTFTVVR